MSFSIILFPSVSFVVPSSSIQVPFSSYLFILPAKFIALRSAVCPLTRFSTTDPVSVPPDLLVLQVDFWNQTLLLLWQLLRVEKLCTECQMAKAHLQACSLVIVTCRAFGFPTTFLENTDVIYHQKCRGITYYHGMRTLIHGSHET